MLALGVSAMVRTNSGRREIRKSIAALLLLTASVFGTALQAHQERGAAAPADSVAAATPTDQLMVPPEDAEQYVVISEAGKHGDQWRWQLADGRTAYRWSQELRGWITELDQVIGLAEDGSINSLQIRGVTMSGNATETFNAEGGTANWKTAVDSGSSPSGGFYVPAGGVTIAIAPLIEKLVAAQGATVDLLPSGKARLTLHDTVIVDGPGGAKTLQMGFMRGVMQSPVPVWLDEDLKYFGQVGYLTMLPKGYEGALAILRDTQDAATAQEVARITQRFLSDDARLPVLFDNVQLFDADNGAFLADQAVLAEGGVIKAIGAAGTLQLPEGGRLIDGTGKTLVPGIWDSHLHIGNDWSVLANMANGITSFRSPGTKFSRALDATTRRASGELLMGEPFISVIIDQKHPLAAQGSEVVSSEAEMIEVIRRVKDAGLWGVKFYTSMKPEWIAPGAEEAHRLGLHVHGHVPATMLPSEAVEAGYDELTHLNFVVMESMPREVIDKSNTRERMEGPARFFKDIDLNTPPLSEFILRLAERQIVVDPTIVIFENLFDHDGGDPKPAYAPYIGIISPAIERSSFISGGYPLIDGYTREDYRKSYAKMVELVGKLHDAGVPIVAGTDGWGIEIIRELEIYQQAGMSTAEVLQTATIDPARIVGADNRTGSIVVGKEADMVLVDGDPSAELGALRRVVTVVSDGYVMDADELREAAGYSGRPK